MRKYITILCFVLLAVFVSCSGSDSSDKPALKKGTYSYLIMDSSKKSLVEGQMMVNAINFDAQMKQYIVTGTYTISKMIDDTSYYSLSSLNAGEFKGYYDDTKKFININTNPRIADANVFINANVKGTGLEGGWYYSTFRGTRNEAGLFTATKIK
jgi:major membrane immunogen (membrane-anchored lipoprotein)